MKIYRQTLPVPAEQIAGIRYILGESADRACFFDIETTGLSPRISSVYLIGAAFLRGDSLEGIQWFADDYSSEKSLLTAFAEALANCSVVIHYNGTTFDIPYLEKKYVEHGLPSPFLSLESLDLYRRVNRQKQRFPTKNRKLVTMEKLLGFDRGQDYSGQECTMLYTDFMQHKFAHRDDEADRLRTCLLSHNAADLQGTALGTELLLYTDPEPCSPSLTLDDQSAIFTAKLPDSLTYPFPLTCETSFAGLDFQDNKFTVTALLIRDTLYHFFPDYKNYYYLPDEDMAIHKSVGTYVDAAHRKQATASTCYVKKEGTFLALKTAPENAVIFHKKNAPKGACYIEAHSASAEMISFLL